MRKLAKCQAFLFGKRKLISESFQLGHNRKENSSFWDTPFLWKKADCSLILIITLILDYKK